MDETEGAGEGHRRRHDRPRARRPHPRPARLRPHRRGGVWPWSSPPAPRTSGATVHAHPTLRRGAQGSRAGGRRPAAEHLKGGRSDLLRPPFEVRPLRRSPRERGNSSPGTGTIAPRSCWRTARAPGRDVAEVHERVRPPAVVRGHPLVRFPVQPLLATPHREAVLLQIEDRLPQHGQRQRPLGRDRPRTCTRCRRTATEEPPPGSGCRPTRPTTSAARHDHRLLLLDCS